jgi:hypothetical protein
VSLRTQCYGIAGTYGFLSSIGIFLARSGEEVDEEEEEEEETEGEEEEGEEEEEVEEGPVLTPAPQPDAELPRLIHPAGAGRHQGGGSWHRPHCMSSSILHG